MDQPIDPTGQPPVDPQQQSPATAPQQPSPALTPSPVEPPPGAYAYAAAPGPLPPTLTAVAPNPAEKPKGSGARVLNVVLGVALVVAIGGLAFAVGRMTAPGSANAAGPFGNGQVPNFSGNGNGGGQGQGGFVGAGGLNLTGNVTAVSPDSITIDVGGRSVTIPLDASTTYQKASTASQSDVTVGSSVTVALDGRLGFRGPNASPGASGGSSGGTTNGQPNLGPAKTVTVNAQ